MKHIGKNVGVRLLVAGGAFIGVLLLVAGLVFSRHPAAKATAAGSTGLTSIAVAPAVRPLSQEVAPIDKYLDSHRDRYRLAVKRAKTWVDSLTIDPLDLRLHKVKGKKKLAECLDFYIRLYDIAPAREKQALMDAIKKRVAITSESRYHDLASLSDIHFKQDATSYLRVAFLMDRVGLDTLFYQDEIKKILPRFNAHMVTRGTDQRMAFHLYYQHFGLAEPFPLASAFQAGIIAARRAPSEINDRMSVYSLTHEIFVPYQFGDKLDARFFSDDDKTYLRPVLSTLTREYIKLNDPDVVSELSSCLSYLQFTDLPVYQTALTYLLDCQQADGKWGNYEAYRPFYGEYVNQGYYLHTTLVALDALTTAFQLLRPPQ